MAFALHGRSAADCGPYRRTSPPLCDWNPWRRPSRYRTVGDEEELPARGTTMAGGEKDRMPKDRGWAWMCVFACFNLLLIELGGAKSFGIIFAEYLEKFDTTTGAAAWISSLNGFFAMALGPFATSLGMRFTNRTLIMIGGVFYGLGYVLSSFAPDITYLYFSYGVVSGIGMGFSYSPAVVSVAQYFEKRRALANGIAVAGSGVGNFLIPLTIRWLIDHYSLQGAMMIYGGIGLNVCVCGALFRPPAFYNRRSLKSDDGAEGGADLKRNDAQNNAGKSGVKCDDPDVDAGRAYPRRSIINHSDSDNELHDNDADTTSLKSNTSKRSSAYYGLSEIATASVQSIPDYITDREDPDEKVEEREDEAADREQTGSCLRSLYKRVCTLPPGPDGQRKNLFDWSLLRNPLFHVYYWSVLLSSCGYPSVFIMLPKFATDVQLSKYHATWLVSIVGISDLVGRITFGFFSDYNIVKKQYGFMGSMFLSGVTCLLFPWVTSFTGLAVLCSIFGLLGGSYIALTAVILVEALGAEKLPNAFGLSVLGQGIAMLVAFPFIGFLRDQTGKWDGSFYFCGLAMIAGASCVLLEPLARRRLDENKCAPQGCFKLGSKKKEVVSEVVSQV